MKERNISHSENNSITTIIDFTWFSVKERDFHVCFSIFLIFLYFSINYSSFNCNCVQFFCKSPSGEHQVFAANSLAHVHWVFKTECVSETFSKNPTLFSKYFPYLYTRPILEFSWGKILARAVYFNFLW